MNHLIQKLKAISAAAITKATINLRRLRRMIFAKGPSALGQRKNSAHQRLEELELWSARATLLILFGIAGEIATLIYFSRGIVERERIVSIIWDVMIGIGLIIEYVVILRAITASGEAQRESDEKVAEANAHAAEANKIAEGEKLARLKLEERLGPRRLSGEQKSKLSAALAAMIPLPIVVACRMLDSEGQDFCEDIASTLDHLPNWHVVRNGSWTQSEKGLFIAMVDPNLIQLQLCAGLSSALNAAEISHAMMIPIQQKNLGTISPHFQTNVLYLLVGAKP